MANSNEGPVIIAPIPRPCRGCGAEENEQHVDDCPEVLRALGMTDAGERQLEMFYITFGRSGIRNGYVRVEAYSENIARAWAHNEYGSCWSGIYTRRQWMQDTVEDRAVFYPKGELGHERLLYQTPPPLRDGTTPTLKGT